MGTIDPTLYYKYPQQYNTAGTTGTGTGTTVDNSTFQSIYNNNLQAGVVNSTPQTEVPDSEKDGKIGFWKAAGNIVKGIGKAVGGFVCSVLPGAGALCRACGWKDAPSFNLKTALITVGTIALMSIPGMQPLGVALAVAGGIGGAIQIGKGVATACKREVDIVDEQGNVIGKRSMTDDEQKQAFQNIGSGALQLGLSVLGAKAGIKSMKGMKGSAMSQVGENAGLKANTKAYFTDLKSSVVGGKGYRTTNLKFVSKKAYNSATKGVTKGEGFVANSKTVLKNVGEGTKGKITSAMDELKVKNAASKNNKATNAQQALKDIPDEAMTKLNALDNADVPTGLLDDLKAGKVIESTDDLNKLIKALEDSGVENAKDLVHTANKANTKVVKMQTKADENLKAIEKNVDDLFDEYNNNAGANAKNPDPDFQAKQDAIMKEIQKADKKLVAAREAAENPTGNAAGGAVDQTKIKASERATGKYDELIQNKKSSLTNGYDELNNTVDGMISKLDDGAKSKGIDVEITNVKDSIAKVDLNDAKAVQNLAKDIGKNKNLSLAQKQTLKNSLTLLDEANAATNMASTYKGVELTDLESILKAGKNPNTSAKLTSAEKTFIQKLINLKQIEAGNAGIVQTASMFSGELAAGSAIGMNGDYIDSAYAQANAEAYYNQLQGAVNPTTASTPYGQIAQAYELPPLTGFGQDGILT